MDMANINKSHEDTVTMQEAIMENINEIADISIDVNEAQNVENTKGNNINVASDPENKVILQFQIVVDKYS